MVIGVKKIRAFRRELKKHCKEGCYNIFVHKHLGDSYYIISFREEFEKHWKKPLHFIINPEYAFLFELFGEKNYSVFDFKQFMDEVILSDSPYLPPAFHKTHPWDMLVKDALLSVPEIDEPFIADTDRYGFYQWDHYWSKFWGYAMGVPMNNLDLKVAPHNIPLSGEVKNTIEMISPLEKAVLFAPEATSVVELPAEMWDIMADVVRSHGYTVFVNSRKVRIRGGICLFDLDLSFKDVVAFGQRCAYVFALRSGLCDVFTNLGSRLYAIYPAVLRREMGSLTKPYKFPTEIHEIQIYNWKMDQFIWEGEDLTNKLQPIINKLHRAYYIEGLKSLFSFKEKGKHHLFWRHLFQEIAKDSRSIPENNVENPPPWRGEKEVKVLGITVYWRKVEVPSGAVRETLLGGLWHERRLGKSKKVCVCGLQVYSRNRRRKRVLGITLKRYDYERRWLQELAQKVGEEYDDVYLLRHNMGETYVELVCMEERVRGHGSKRPLVVAREKRYEELCRMMLPKGIEVRLIPLDQGEIHDIFCEQGKEYREIMIEAEGHRFFCSTPRIAEHMVELRRKDPHVNFYSYICESVGAKAERSIPRLQAQEEVREQAKVLMQREGLEEGKYVVLLPEAVSTQLLPEKFWHELEEELTKRGYKTYINWTMESNAVVPVEVLVEVSRYAAGVITLGSGVSIVLAREVRHMDIIYTPMRNPHLRAYGAEMVMQLYSVRHLPGIDMQNIREYGCDKLPPKALKEQLLKQFEFYADND